MSLGDDAPGAHHVELMKVDPTYRPTHSRPWRDPEVEAIAERDALEEERAALDDQIAYLRRHGCDCLRRALDDWERTRRRLDALPDLRGSLNVGADEREQWRGSA